MLQPGDTLNHGAYRIERKLGKGGFGLVCLATEVALHRLVAIKTLQPEWAEQEPAITEAFAAEARLAARLSHPHIVPIYFVGEEGGVRYLVMEYLPGGDLEGVLARGAPPMPQVLRWLHEAALGLACAHGQGIVHRDLKLRNVLLTADGHLKIADFGLAKAMGAQTKTVLKAVGTPAYVSPEQIQGRSTDARSDLYALGIMAYQLATGRLPYDAPDITDTTAKLMAISYQHVHAPIPSAQAANAAVPPGLDALITRLLAKTPEARPASAAEVVQTLEELRHPARPSAIPPTQALSTGMTTTRPTVAATEAAILPTETVSDATQPGVGATRTVVGYRPAPAPLQGRRWSWKWLAVPGLLLAMGGGTWGVKAYLDTEARRAAEAQREAEVQRQAEEARRAEEERQARLRDEAERQRREAEAREDEARRRADEQRRRDELTHQARLREEEDRRRAEVERQRAEEQRKQEEAKQREAARKTALDLLQRGGEKMRSGNYRGAIEDATQGIRSDPGIPSLYVMRGAARISIGEYKEALAEFDEVVRRWPDNAPAFYNRARAREQLGDKQGATQDYQKAAELSSSQGNTRLRQAALDATKRLQQPPAPDPDELRRRAADTYLKGLGKLQTRDYKGAIEDFTETLRLNPKHPDARYQRSGAYLALADYKAALADLDETLRLSPENALAAMRRASVRQKLGDNPGAIQDYRKAADLYAAQGNPGMQKRALDSASELEASLRPQKRGVIGWGDARSVADAEQVALNNCRLNGGVSCKVLTRFCTGKPGGPPSYGAIAYSSSARRSGYSQNYGTVAGAQDGAMRQCRENDCKIITSVKNTCAALAVE